MIYPKISSCLSKIACTFVLSFCCVGSLKAVISDGKFSELMEKKKDAEDVKEDIKKKENSPQASSAPITTDMLTEKPNIIIVEVKKNGEIKCKNGTIDLLESEKKSLLLVQGAKGPLASIKFMGKDHLAVNPLYTEVDSEKNTLIFGDVSKHIFPTKQLKEGLSLYFFEDNKNKFSWKKGTGENNDNPVYSSESFSPFFELTASSSSEKEVISFQMQQQDGSTWIKSNGIISSKSREALLKLQPHEKHSFLDKIVKIIGIGTLKKDGSFKFNSNVSSASLSAEDIKKGVTFVLQDGKVAWHPELIPFEELESNQNPVDDYYAVEQPYQAPNYEPVTETQAEPERSYFSLSDNKGTVACTAIGVAVTAIVAHVLSGRRYLSKADTWSNWEPNNLNSIGLRSLPEDVLLKQLYHEIAYRYGNYSDQIQAFLEEIEQEIHDLNLCYWSYSTLRGIYLLPKIQRFEEIEDRINLLKMLADTVRQDLANKSIKNLLS